MKKETWISRALKALRTKADAGRAGGLPHVRDERNPEDEEGAVLKEGFIIDGEGKRVKHVMGKWRSNGNFSLFFHLDTERKEYFVVSGNYFRHSGEVVDLRKREVAFPDLYSWYVKYVVEDKTVFTLDGSSPRRFSGRRGEMCLVICLTTKLTTVCFDDVRIRTFGNKKGDGKAHRFEARWDGPTVWG